MDEIIDIFDKDFQHLGTALKSKAHREGLWHQTFQCWIVRKRGDDYFILFQKRADNKEDSPGLLDISAAGHLGAGERKEDGVREIKEEIGIDVDAEDLHYLGIRVAEYMYKHINNKEFCRVFLLEDDTPLVEYKLQESEVKSLIEVKLQDALNLFTGKVKKIHGLEFAAAKGGNTIELTEIHESDFVYRKDPYYIKICNIALSYFQGATFDKENPPWNWKRKIKE